MREYILILTVENEESINNRNTDLPHRYFEQESINCIAQWRLNAGWLKDIPIYIMNPTGDVSPETKEYYTSNNICYISTRPLSFKEHEHGFFNVHYCGRYFELLPKLQNKMLIHIDLDMEILKPFPESYFDELWNGTYTAYCGGYLPNDYKDQREPLYSSELTNTDFIVNICGVYNFYEHILESINIVDNEYSKYVSIGYREYDREEYCSDYLLASSNIKLIIGYEQGEGYSITPKPNDVYFWHEHFYKKQNIRLKIQKYNLLKIIKA